jgi:carbonic anhydrase/acetyltransferase-like protein (isoleucine patch superfamily)
MLVEHRGHRPRIHPTAWIAPTAVVCGDVEVGPEARVLWHAVLTAEDGRIEIGARTVVMEHALVRGRAASPALIGSDVLIGPHAHVNGAVVEDEVFVATGVSIFPNARIGAGSELRISSVVHVNSVVAPGTTLPIGWIAAGDPAQLFSPDRHDELWELQRPLDFPRTVYGVPRGTPMREIMPRQAAWFGAHRDDVVLERGS